MRHPTSLALHSYWNALHREALRGGRSAPGRDEVDPAAIRGVLASVFLLDMGSRPDDAAFRLSGTRLDALFGRPLRGTAFHRLWAAGPTALGSLLGAVVGTASGEGRPAVAAVRGGPPGRDAVDLELLLLPLDGGRTALGSLAPFTTPGWLGLAAAAPLRILAPGEGRTPHRTGFGRRIVRPPGSGTFGGRRPGGGEGAAPVPTAP